MKFSVKFIVVVSSILICSCSKPGQNSWEQIANGVWKYTSGDPEAYNLLDAVKAVPRLDQLNESGTVDFPFDMNMVEVNDQDGKLYIKFPLDNDEHIYGLGLQFKSVNRRGKIYNLHVDHYGGEDNGRTHAPVPFYVSSKGYGVLINSARYITVYVGSANRVDSPNPPVVYDRNTDKNWSAQPESDMVEILVPGSDAEIIVFNGDSPLEAVSKYNLYCGGGVLPPKWGLGFTYRTHTLYPAGRVLEEVDNFERNGFPLDFIGLEPGWMNMSYPCSYEWSEERFPDPAGFLKKMTEKKVRVNLWMNPYIAPKAKLYGPMLPYAGTHTVWNGIVPDYTIPEAREIFLDFYQKNQLDIGVSGLKIDEIDGYDSWLWPDVASFPSGKSAEVMRQTYGLVMQDMISGIYHNGNIRTWGLTRASNAGASSLPFVIYNDYYKHEDFITALINSGFSGILWTPEARSSDSAEEWLRRIQSVCFSPMAMINAWASGTLPWSYPEVYEDVKEVALLRMQLLPYIYSTFAEYHFYGIPPVRPMQLVQGFKANKMDIKDQYMFGENILVAPVFTGQTKRTVILPPGKWYDFYSGDFVGENEIIEIEAIMSEIPLFVRDGGIIPMIPPGLHTPKNGEILPLEVRQYGQSDGEFILYDDDGETFNYEMGEYSWTRLKNGTAKREYGTIFNYNKITWNYMTK
jgi:alpha-D-xyloside xylohydrolase